MRVYHDWEFLEDARFLKTKHEWLIKFEKDKEARFGGTV